MGSKNMKSWGFFILTGIYSFYIMSQHANLISKLNASEQTDVTILNLYCYFFKERNPQVNSEKLGGEKIADTFLFPGKTWNQKNTL